MSQLTPTARRKAWTIAAAAYPLIAALSRTLTWRIEGGSRYAEIVRAGRQPILAVWHGRIFGGLLHFRGRGIVAITSQNFDGEWIARLLIRFGYGTARGSTSRGGARALVQLRRDLASGRGVAFTVDGPRGPARVAQPGAIWLAGATGNPVLPFHLEANRAWEVGSWDRAQIPKPFATIAMVIGEPMFVPGTDDALVEAKTRELEQILGGLEARARQLLSETTT
ncbi:MAG: lysophospholipid acyltransferase family protein [Vicinamibacterales bacterium]